eukprot:TRINITY_DN13597_c0_g1_i3.p1 TRINITY_DN13597_c0_g1~~TRINITY_DN13597_c0_g1_i3.p1  ORF type:complete len:233 (-),score=58.42 TRINITY_DN13597_c0_g1_i3:156-854(-)
MIRRPPRSTLSSSSAASDVYKRQVSTQSTGYYKESWASSCVGGVVPPPAVNVTCYKCKPEDYMEMWSDCVDGKQSLARMVKADKKGCIENTKTFNTSMESRTCHKIEASIGANKFTGGIMGFALIVGGAIIVIYVLHRRHADLEHKFQRLAADAQEASEMDHEDGFEGAENDDDDDGIGFSTNNQPAKSLSKPRDSSTAREAVEALNNAIASVPAPGTTQAVPSQSPEPHAA